MPHADQKNHDKINEAKMESNRQQEKEIRPTATVVMVDDDGFLDASFGLWLLLAKSREFSSIV
jgi:hypothetical protein